jgi:hypothetical protein
MEHAAPLLIAPECAAPGCHYDGDQHMMVKCRSCGLWFCKEHLKGDDSGLSITLVDTGLHGLAYNLGYCTTCREKQPVRRPVDSSWLR